VPFITIVEHIFPFRDVSGVQQMTTEILTMDEYSDRRKLGRTSIFARIKSGDYIEGIDFLVDGNEKKFFWPPKELIRRDMLLQNIFIDSAAENANSFKNVQLSQAKQKVVSEESMNPNMSEDQVKQKPSRCGAPSTHKISKGRKLPAFDI